jgi:hypothetical protein
MSDTTEHVYMLWDCQDCGHKAIPCSPTHTACPSCGEVRTFGEFDQAYLPGDNDTWEDHHHHAISQEDWDRLGAAGASWFCVVCYADNYGDQSSCHHCGTKRKATDKELRDDTSYESYVAFMDGDQGASADLVEEFGEYAGMRAAHGESFNMNDRHEGQLERANEGRSAFQAYVDLPHESRPEWEESDLPSSIESESKYKEDLVLDEEVLDEEVLAENQAPRENKGPSRWERWKAKIVALWKWLVALVCGTTATGVGVWGLQTYEVEGYVVARQWERSIQEHKWTQVRDSDWRMNITERRERKPSFGVGGRKGVKILSCHNKHHHYEEYQCGTKDVSCTHMESYSEDYSCTKHRTESYSCTKSRSESYSCGTYQCNCTTSRNSNGTASRSCGTCTKTCSRSVDYSSTCTKSVPYDSTCTRTKQRAIHNYDTVPKYCDRSIEKSYCDYATQEWEKSDYYVEQGSDLPAKWPEGSLQELEKEVRRESYTLVFKYDHEGKVQSFKKDVALSDLKKVPMSSPVTFTVTNFGTIQDWKLGHLKKDRH